MSDRIGTLTADTVATVVVTSERIEILNRDGAAEIFYTVDGPAPEVEDTADKVLCLPAVAGAYRVFYRDSRPDQDKDHTVRLISDGTPTYSVTAL